MRKITVCDELPMRVPPGADHDMKYNGRRMSPGTAWKIDDMSKDHIVVEVDEATCKKAAYEWKDRWIDGRSVAVFKVGADTYCQPTTEDARAKDVALGSTRKRRTKHKTIRKSAPGVAPPAVGEPEPERHTRRRSAELSDGEPIKRRGRSGPRGGLSLVD